MHRDTISETGDAPRYDILNGRCTVIHCDTISETGDALQYTPLRCTAIHCDTISLKRAMHRDTISETGDDVQAAIHTTGGMAQTEELVKLQYREK
jgi:hypothetical protein